jgi:YVTN family beta-propeller protein
MINRKTVVNFFVVFGLSITALNTTAANVIDEMTGTVVVVNKLGDNVSFVDLATKKVFKTVATGKGPHELAITKDGKWAVTTDYVGGNSLTVLDIAQTSVVRTISLKKYPQPHGILFMQDQTHVAVSSEGSNTAVIVNIHTGAIVKELDTTQNGSHMVALPALSNKVYTTNMADDSVSVLDVKTARLDKLIPMPKTPEAITINQAGTELWVGRNHDGLVSLFNANTNEQIKQWTGYTFPYRILLTRDERYGVIPDYRQNTLDVFDVANKTKLNRINLGANDGPKGVTFAPDDRTLFLSLYAKDKIIAISIPSGKVLFELPSGDGPDGIGYSEIILTGVNQ